MSLANVSLLVRLPSGNRAVYEVQPQHLPREDLVMSAQWPTHFGRQVAHELDGKWYRPGGWEEITDPRTCELLATRPEADK